MSEKMGKIIPLPKWKQVLETQPAEIQSALGKIVKLDIEIERLQGEVDLVIEALHPPRVVKKEKEPFKMRVLRRLAGARPGRPVRSGPVADAVNKLRDVLEVAAKAGKKSSVSDAELKKVAKLIGAELGRLRGERDQFEKSLPPDALQMALAHRKETEEIQRALRKEEDKEKVEEKEEKKDTKTPQHAERRDYAVSWSRAREVMGQDYLGAEAIKNAFGVEVGAPSIPFSEEELLRAKELGQMLVLRVDTLQGEPTSIRQINDLLAEKWKREEKGDVLNTYQRWRHEIKGEKLFEEEAIRPGWALVSKDLVPETTDKNYIEQTERLVTHLKEDIFKDQNLKGEYAQAVQEFESQKAELTELMTSNWQECAKRLVELKITQLCRQTDEENIYDLALYYSATGKRLLPNKYSWSGSCSQDGSLVGVGAFDAGGVYGGRWDPEDHSDFTGVLFSRRV